MTDYIKNEALEQLELDIKFGFENEDELFESIREMFYNEALQVVNKIVSTLKENSFEISWTGTVDQRIEIKNINWQKIPDNEDWDSERVISILTKTNNNKKTFWKFW